MKKLILFAPLALLLLSLNACKKDSTDNPDDTPEQPQENVLCEGKSGNNSYFPLAVGNHWEYGYNYFTSGLDNIEWTITGTKKLETTNQTYFVLEINRGSFFEPIEQYLRVDANTGDVFEFAYGQDALLIPGNPTLNQNIGPEPGNGLVPERKVISTTGKIKTKECSYTDCIIIESYGQQGGSVGRDYYKKGLGKVYSTDHQLEDATIK